PDLTPEDLNGLRSVASALSGTARDRLLVLALKWGRSEALQEFREGSVQSLKRQMADPALSDGDRLAAARHLIRLADETSSVNAVLEQVTPQASPAFSAPLIASVGESRQAASAAALISAWDRLSPGQKRAALGVLLRRPEWSSALLDSVADGRVLRNDLNPEHWQQLGASADAALAARARDLKSASGTVSADRQEVVRSMAAAAETPGDAARGKELFAANCAVCHRFQGTGQQIGPDLTGIGVRPRSELLLEILDPNRSVEANYRLWTLTTKSGDTLAGRLDGETLTSVELTDLVGQKHTVARGDISSLESANQSIMPAGFESLGADGLAALLAHLATP
ncbi:MAG: c-type cytochrome, partial [Verrucomicrobia bacterium]|nr:c-type cytochrome [Verrucomicrobiota bacterium]